MGALAAGTRYEPVLHQETRRQAPRGAAPVAVPAPRVSRPEPDVHEHLRRVTALCGAGLVTEWELAAKQADLLDRV